MPLRLQGLRRARWAVGLVAAAIVATTHVARAEPNTVTCTLARDGQQFSGSCLVPCMVNALWINIDGPRADRSCTTPPREVQASLRPQPRFDDFLGSMQGKEPEDPTRFSLILPRDGQPGVAKLPYGWFALTQAAVAPGALTLVIDASRQLPPTQDDIRIVQRATALLASPAVWNKADDRQCPPEPTRWSLFCAMMQATTEVSGGVHYRQPAMQAVREVLNEVGGERVRLHRIMDYNNHPATTLDDIHALLARAQAKLEHRFR
jgi:hypothetical protein